MNISFNVIATIVKQHGQNLNGNNCAKIQPKGTFPSYLWPSNDCLIVIDPQPPFPVLSLDPDPVPIVQTDRGLGLNQTCTRPTVKPETKTIKIMDSNLNKHHRLELNIFNVRCAQDSHQWVWDYKEWIRSLPELVLKSERDQND